MAGLRGWWLSGRLVVDVALRGFGSAGARGFPCLSDGSMTLVDDFFVDDWLLGWRSVLPPGKVPGWVAEKAATWYCEVY